MSRWDGLVPPINGENGSMVAIWESLSIQALVSSSGSREDHFLGSPGGLGSWLQFPRDPNLRASKGFLVFVCLFVLLSLCLWVPLNSFYPVTEEGIGTQ